MVTLFGSYNNTDRIILRYQPTSLQGRRCIHSLLPSNGIWSSSRQPLILSPTRLCPSDVQASLQPPRPGLSHDGAHSQDRRRRLRRKISGGRCESSVISNQQHWFTATIIRAHTSNFKHGGLSSTPAFCCHQDGGAAGRSVWLPRNRGNGCLQSLFSRPSNRLPYDFPLPTTFPHWHSGRHETRNPHGFCALASLARTLPANPPHPGSQLSWPRMLEMASRRWFAAKASYSSIDYGTRS
jgi:hypothetical protein